MSASPAASDLSRQSSLHSVDRLGNSGSATLGDLLRNFCLDSSIEVGQYCVDDGRRQNEAPFLKQEEVVWEDISKEGKVQKVEFEEITLEDFLARAETGTESNSLSGHAFLKPQTGRSSHGYQLVDRSLVGEDEISDLGHGERGKRKMSEDPLDGASQHKQKRMIKNRESAARSRERKQAYIQQLESLITRLEEERVMLLEEQAERGKQRLIHLMKNLTPVTEKKRPPPPPRLRRTSSWQW
ncbi:bZIP transcription factor 12-like isoform X2 [Wolffia australiana]